MQLAFQSNKTTEISFKVGIAGTSATPSSVSVVLEKDNKALSFKASMVDGEWKALIENPGKIFEAGPVQASISVILNNRIFSPYKTTAEIVSDVSTSASVTEAKVVETPVLVEQEPKSEKPESTPPKKVEQKKIEKPIIQPALVKNKPQPALTPADKGVITEKITKVAKSLIGEIEPPLLPRKQVKEAPAMMEKQEIFKLKKIKVVTK